jgi:hypothetical protein
MCLWLLSCVVSVSSIYLSFVFRFCARTRGLSVSVHFQGVLEFSFLEFLSTLSSTRTTGTVGTYDRSFIIGQEVHSSFRRADEPR